MRLRSLRPPQTGLPHANSITAPLAKFPIPDPRLWPVAPRDWLRAVKGEGARWNDVVLFDCGDCAAAYLEDAVILAQIAAPNPAGWSVDEGFPALVFDSALIGEYSARLSSHGYHVRVAGDEKPAGKLAKRRRRSAKVIDIAAARQLFGRRNPARP
ncbi:MAG TPA: hypothetical protein VKV17_17890 [Bryobacteraceae bacterium]|nr:hypothetical protein [Bryobacteraceae bacterium]